MAAAHDWGTLAASAGLVSEAAEGFAAAVSILPEAAWHGLNRQTRQVHLAGWAGLAADAAAEAVVIDRPDRAVEFLEAGRSVLWTQSLSLRTDLSELRAMHPELAERLDSLRAVLNNPIAGSASTVPVGVSDRVRTEATEVRRRAARDWDQTLSQVRTLGGFEHFLQSVPYKELATAADTGPVVIVNASRYGCHALIVEALGRTPSIIALPGLTVDAAADYAAQMFRSLTLSDLGQSRNKVRSILEWLWDVIAQPVLVALGHASGPGEGASWPRVWWCPTGPVTMLPVHAAGYHARDNASAHSMDTVLDRVISSYTPTLAALRRARQSSSDAIPVRQLTVGLPLTLGRSSLPAVPREVLILQHHFPAEEGNQLLAGSQATRAAFLSAARTCTWLHMACHASQMHEEPDLSGFALWDSPATVRDLAALPIRDRELAFLSACQTAAGTARNSDEAIHLAAAMQFLGYRHVIATMWSINDSVAPIVADAFYTGLKSGRDISANKAGEALHQAVRAVRDKIPANPLVWAPYIHIGP
jgi:hypothetical protein